MRLLCYMLWMVLFFLRQFICKDTGLMNATETTLFLKSVFQKYDKKILPRKEGVDVTVQMFIEDMVPLETINSHYSIDIYFRTYWDDHRLNYQNFISDNVSSSQAFSNDFVESIWLPDLFFPLVKEGEAHKVLKPNQLIRLSSNGSIFFSQRLTLTVYCPMNLRHFPFDVQRCNFTMLSFAYSFENIRINWNTNNNGPIFPPVDTNMLEYTFSGFEYGKFVDDYKVAGNIETLYVQFVFTRNHPYYIISMYLPIVLIVIISWVGFWIDYRSTPARVSLGITTVLTMATLSNNIRGTVPQTSYTKSLDIYLLVCFFYVFAALGEYAIVGITDMKLNKIRKKRTLKKESSVLSLSTRVSIQSDDWLESSLNSPVSTTSFFSNENEEDMGRNNLSFQSFISPRCLDNRVTYKTKTDKSKNKNFKDQIKKKSVESLRRTKEKVQMKLLKEQVKDLESHFIDKMSRYIFPTSFVFLNIVYFLYYGVRKT